MTKRTYTVGELIEELQALPKDIPVKLEDADTNWTIPTFEVRHDKSDNVIWFHPCSYSEMEH